MSNIRVRIRNPEAIRARLRPQQGIKVGNTNKYLFDPDLILDSVEDARDWAIKTDGLVDEEDYSSKAWAIGGTGTETNNSKYYAEQSATSASNASTSETNAGLSATSASNSASTATTQAGIATTQAGIATTKAGEAATSASTATTQAGIATAKAIIASDKADEASSSASDAYYSASNAETSAINSNDYATASAASSTLSRRYAIGEPSEPSEGSAKYWADQAAQSAASITVNDATLTIQKNSTTLGTFTANQATDETIDIDVPDIGVLPYATSTTAAATVQKEVSIPSITELNAGQVIVVQPTITSTVANSTIKLNNFPAYLMLYNNAAITTSTDSIVWSASFPSQFIFDGSYWVFLGHGSDSNSTYTLNALIDAGRYTAGTGTYAVTRYSILAEKADGTWEKITATNANYSTATSKSVNTNGFRLGQLRYYNTTTTVANGGLIATNTCNNQAASVDLRYSTNCGGTTTWLAGDFIYLVGTIGADGLFYLDTTTWWSNALPTTADSKYYVRIGIVLTDASYTCSFLLDRHVFYYDNGIKEYTGAGGGGMTMTYDNITKTLIWS